MVQKSGEKTTWDVEHPVNSGINYLSTGAGFLPSTVVPASSFAARMLHGVADNE